MHIIKIVIEIIKGALAGNTKYRKTVGTLKDNVYSYFKRLQRANIDRWLLVRAINN